MNILYKFYVREGFFSDYHFSGDKGIKTLNVWGKPFDFFVYGNDKTAAFNAWAGMAISLSNGGVLAGFLPSERGTGGGVYIIVTDSAPFNDAFHNKKLSRFSILKDNKWFYDATNDALAGSYLILSYEGTNAWLQRVKALKKKPKTQKTLNKQKDLRKQLNKIFDTLSSLIDDNGHLSCCMIDGKVYNEMYSRHGLVVASLVYAYKVLGKELYAEKAKKLADYFIEHNYHKEGYFDNWISIGTDSEICTGLLEVYDITGDKKYLQICENVAKYYDSPHAKMTHDPQGHKDLRHDQHIYSTVDQAEFVILLKNLYAFTKNKHYLDMARGILKDLQMCYDTKWKLYSHICYWNGKHDDHFFAVIQAIIYIAML